MPVLVMKFGGTSVATLDRIRRAAKRVGVEVAKGYDVIVIVSAMSGKTNELVGWGFTAVIVFGRPLEDLPILHCFQHTHRVCVKGSSET